ncbi:4'-phosphopantetheinyl transferase [Kitasatospora sp. NPDC088391]|uniref:4'-phosphopantetheinyl transferase family protein n=1 Tax=Kitasatospora sp. NPDC088391 TaxID=3364074 RepID=UPI0037FB57D8
MLTAGTAHGPAPATTRPAAPRPDASFAALLPDFVRVAETTSDPDGVELYPGEERIVRGAPAAGVREFTTARHCARVALGRLGVPPAPILSAEGGAPLWPAGVVGSITHCPGYRAAAVARTADTPAIGIDAEVAGALPRGVLALVSLPQERAELAALARRPAPVPVPWDTLLFSAKEAVYKAWYPLARGPLGFHDAHLTFDPDNGTFAARLLVPGPTVAGRELRGFTGRWLAGDGLVLTAATAPVL